MIGNDWTRLVDRWLRHPEYGFGAMLAAALAERGLAPISEVLIRNDVESADCQKEYRPKGGNQYLVIGTEPVEMAEKRGKGRATDEDHVAVGLFYMAEVGDFGRALDHAEPVLEAALASLRLLCEKGFIDTKVEAPDDGRESWQAFGRVRVVEMGKHDAVRLRATAQSQGAVAVAALFARLKGLRTTFEPTGVA